MTIHVIKVIANDFEIHIIPNSIIILKDILPQSGPFIVSFNLICDNAPLTSR